MSHHWSGDPFQKSSAAWPHEVSVSVSVVDYNQRKKNEILELNWVISKLRNLKVSNWYECVNLTFAERTISWINCKFSVGTSN